ncbi:hypothetical protein PpBr36_08479 [Pyricularia pennisetigena]|uniref:hypothetical protein n=1 Tax=Pyricularia pennisetigena TaxID=1578925 RepID=UPI00114FDEB2|nr:hypothetical protein PpBr36_08479 [Pyricularia pennisetigena]TLS24111.1 hypothetical protein PpBr36_08479 [Pyricularia pennisetigena]
MPSSTGSSRSRSSSPPSPTTPDPRRPLLPRAVAHLPPRSVPLRYAWRGKMTWPLRGDPRRYSTFPPYTDGNPIVIFGRNVVSWLVLAFWWLATVLKMTLWNFPAGLIIGLFTASNLGPLQASVPPVSTYGLIDASVFVQSPGVMVDQAWQSIGANMRNIVVQESELIPGLDLNKSHVRVAEQYGGGYVLELQTFHNIHCLNILHQALHFNARQHHKTVTGSRVSRRDALKETGKTILTNCKDVCLETLREHLMCLADGSAHGFVWVDHESNLIAPDINSNHRICHDFDKIRLWAESRQVPRTLPEDYYQLPTV